MFVGRPSWLSTSTPIASAPNGITVAKYNGLPSTMPSGCFTYGMIVSCSFDLQPASPANASEAPINFKKLRRSTDSSHSERVPRKFPVHQFVKMRIFGQLVERAPVLLARLGAAAWRAPPPDPAAGRSASAEARLLPHCRAHRREKPRRSGASRNICVRRRSYRPS